jgi:Flp pilus assembly protein TadG
MSLSGIRTQRGQAMTEFMVAMLALLPLFFGVIYMGKFADVKHQAIQASRFAAFERALDPGSKHESDAVIIEEARARFFTDLSPNDKIGYQDTTAGQQTAATLNANWMSATGTPLIQQYSNINVKLASNSMNIGAFTAVNEASSVFDHLNRNGEVQADVTVPIVNIAHLPAPLNNLNLSVAATTVVAGDAWNGGGAHDVADQQTLVTDMGKNPLLKVLQVALDGLATVFTDVPAPTFGCVKADVVPVTTAPGAHYKDTDPCS